MELTRILEALRKEIAADDMVREKIIPLARAAVRACSESIKESHRGDFDKAEDLLGQAHNIISDAKKELPKSEFMSKSRILYVAYQELAEAANVLSILRHNCLTPPEIHEIPTRAYLTGLADTVGELRRAVLDSLRAEDVNRGENLLTFMEEILDGLHSFDFPNALVPELRRKCDVARGLVERTRGDLTMAAQQGKLVKELRAFEERMKDD